MQLKRDLSIRPADRVLEIGPGGLPHPRADIFVEKYLGEEGRGQRGGLDLKTNGKPLVVADAIFLPFSDKAFDYVICSHVLEHIEQPDILLQELARVGRRGYIECPSEIYELLWDVPEHLWFVNVDDGLVLRRKTRENAGYFGKFWPLAYNHLPEFKTFLRSYPELFYVSYEWSGRPTLRIVGENCTLLNFHDEAALMRLIEMARTRAAEQAGTIPVSFVDELALFLKAVLPPRWVPLLRAIYRGWRRLRHLTPLLYVKLGRVE